MTLQGQGLRMRNKGRGASRLSLSNPSTSSFTQAWPPVGWLSATEYIPRTGQAHTLFPVAYEAKLPGNNNHWAERKDVMGVMAGQCTTGVQRGGSREVRALCPCFQDNGMFPWVNSHLLLFKSLTEFLRSDSGWKCLKHSKVFKMGNGGSETKFEGKKPTK